jgi:hypothetical protein
MLLEGSCGRIECVLVIKLFPLARDASKKERGFVEVWTYDKSLNKKIKLGKRKTLYPAPKSTKNQTISFSWKQIFRERLAAQSGDSEAPPPFN